VVPHFLPPELRMPSRQEVAGVMMRWLQPLVVDGELRTSPGCGAYRNWIVFCMRDDSVWLALSDWPRDEEARPGCGLVQPPLRYVDRFHPTLEEGVGRHRIVSA
jgi:hypothetical protein